MKRTKKKVKRKTLSNTAVGNVGNEINYAAYFQVSLTILKKI